MSNSFFLLVVSIALIGNSHTALIGNVFFFH